METGKKETLRTAQIQRGRRDELGAVSGAGRAEQDVAVRVDGAERKVLVGCHGVGARLAVRGAVRTERAVEERANERRDDRAREREETIRGERR